MDVLGLGLGVCVGGMGEVGWLCVYWWVSGWVGEVGTENEFIEMWLVGWVVYGWECGVRGVRTNPAVK